MKRDYEDFLLNCLDELVTKNIVQDGSVRFRLHCILDELKDNPEVQRLKQNMQKDKEDALIFTKDDALFLFQAAHENMNEVRNKHKVQVLELESDANKRLLEYQLEVERLKTEVQNVQPIDKIVKDNLLFQEDLMALSREKDQLQKQVEEEKRALQQHKEQERQSVEVISAHIRSVYDRRRQEAQERLNILDENFVKEFNFEHLDPYELRIKWREHLELVRLCLESHL